MRSGCMAGNSSADDIEVWPSHEEPGEGRKENSDMRVNGVSTIHMKLFGTVSSKTELCQTTPPFTSAIMSFGDAPDLSVSVLLHVLSEIEARHGVRQDMDFSGSIRRLAGIPNHPTNTVTAGSIEVNPTDRGSRS